MGKTLVKSTGSVSLMNRGLFGCTSESQKLLKFSCFPLFSSPAYARKAHVVEDITMSNKALLYESADGRHNLEYCEKVCPTAEQDSSVSFFFVSQFSSALDGSNRKKGQCTPPDDPE